MYHFSYHVRQVSDTEWSATQLRSGTYDACTFFRNVPTGNVVTAPTLDELRVKLKALPYLVWKLFDREPAPEGVVEVWW